MNLPIKHLPCIPIEWFIPSCILAHSYCIHSASNVIDMTLTANMLSNCQCSRETLYREKKQKEKTLQTKNGGGAGGGGCDGSLHNSFRYILRRYVVGVQV